MEIKAEVKVVIKNGSLFMMGPGVFSLLCAIRDSSSVSEAARTLEISYSKAWKMIREAEKGSGESLVIRSSGGKGGGKASLTPT
ncbi:MAG: LysR family transcriptional regulator, partial [Sphaerochaetaceae bacterium]|nr:LysR family transcriptional regulator [Sphaerochaetaceae bacterium]